MASVFTKLRGFFSETIACRRPAEPSEVFTRELLRQQLTAEPFKIVTSSAAGAWSLLHDKKQDARDRWGALLACDNLWKMHDDVVFLDDVIELVESDKELRMPAISILRERLCGTRNPAAAKALATAVLDETDSVTIRFQAYAALWSTCEPRQHNGDVYSLASDALVREYQQRPFGQELLDKIDWNIVKRYA